MLTVGNRAIMLGQRWLDGYEFDLDDLIALLPSGDTRVIKDGDAYYLTSTEIDHRP